MIITSHLSSSWKNIVSFAFIKINIFFIFLHIMSFFKFFMLKKEENQQGGLDNPYPDFLLFLRFFCFLIKKFPISTLTALLYILLIRCNSNVFEEVYHGQF